MASDACYSSYNAHNSSTLLCCVGHGATAMPAEGLACVLESRSHGDTTVSGYASLCSSQSDETYCLIAGQHEDLVDICISTKDGACRSLSVAEGLRTCDLCELMTVKNHVARDHSWTLVEKWQTPAIERMVEDHEEVANVHRSMRQANTSSVFEFRSCEDKYEPFFNSQAYFPECMSDLPHNVRVHLSPQFDHNTAIQNMLTMSTGAPEMFGWLWISAQRANTSDSVVSGGVVSGGGVSGGVQWQRSYFWLCDGALYRHRTASTHQATLDQQKQAAPERDLSQFVLHVQLDSHLVYSCHDARRQFGAPWKAAVVLRGACADEGQACECLACEDDSLLRCWIAALRLAKYGRAIYDNYLYQKWQQDGFAGGAVAALSRGRVNSQPSSGAHRPSHQSCRPRASTTSGVTMRPAARQWTPSCRVPAVTTTNHYEEIGDKHGGRDGGMSVTTTRLRHRLAISSDMTSTICAQASSSGAGASVVGEKHAQVSVFCRQKSTPIDIVRPGATHCLSDCTPLNSQLCDEQTNQCVRVKSSGEVAVEPTGRGLADQPWFHGSLSRHQVAQLLNKHLCKNGVFLVRRSQTMSSSYVLSFVQASNIRHTHIAPVYSSSCMDVDEWSSTVATASTRPLWSLDAGRTRFYDLLQLVEFYQLNAGVLPTRLTHYVTRGGGCHSNCVGASAAAS